jgi:DNA-directed RNA polymerase alpha subunit
MTSVCSYRLYCTDCGNDDTVYKDQDRRDTHWKVESLINHEGVCPSCNEMVDLDDLEDGEDYHEVIELRKLDGIGDKAATNLERKDYTTVEKIQSLPDDELLAVDWVGQKALESLKERTMQLDPQQRW